MSRCEGTIAEGVTTVEVPGGPALHLTAMKHRTDYFALFFVCCSLTSIIVVQLGPLIDPWWLGAVELFERKVLLLLKMSVHHL